MSEKKGTRQKGANQTSRKATSRAKLPNAKACAEPARAIATLFQSESTPHYIRAAVIGALERAEIHRRLTAKLAGKTWTDDFERPDVFSVRKVSQLLARSQEFNPSKADDLDGAPVTLSLTITEYDRAIQPRDIRDWKHEAEKYARILEHSDCPPAFKTAFESVFIDCLVNEEGGMSMTSTELIRVLYPLTFIRAGDDISVTADAYRMSLLRLCETLVPHEVREAVASAMRAESEGAK